MTPVIHCDRCDTSIERGCMDVLSENGKFYLSCPFCGDQEGLRDAIDGALLERIEVPRGALA